MPKVEIFRGETKNTREVSSSGSAAEAEIRRKARLKIGSGESASECRFPALGSDEKILDGRSPLLG
jgi:hypothetical protein